MSRDELADVGLGRDRSSNWILAIFGAVGSESRHPFRIELEQAFHNFLSLLSKARMDRSEAGTAEPAATGVAPTPSGLRCVAENGCSRLSDHLS